MENEARRDMLETYAKALEGGLMPLDAAKALAGRMEADKGLPRRGTAHGGLWWECGLGDAVHRRPIGVRR